MDSKQTISASGLRRNESDTLTALVALLLGMLVLLCTVALGLHLLSGLPPVMADGVVFSVLVFGVVCAVAFLKSDLSPRHAGPPELKFRTPRRRPRRSAARPKPLR